VTNSQAPAPSLASPRGGKRERLIAAARQLFHEQGVEKTTLADIAAAADVPAGNVFYYFKTKDALVSAVIGAYGAAQVSLARTFDRQETPQARLKAMVRSWVDRRELFASHGCPVGSLASELGKREDGLHGESAVVLSGLIDWAEEQFTAMGREDARELAVAFVAAYEGVSLLANVLQDPSLITTEAQRLEAWIDGLAGEAVGAAAN
jgi:TetR/AcrR family transcriptional regulator, transcriptional repressor for nem operon